MNLQKISNNEDGFVLVVALMIMAILSLIGIAGLNTSIFEEQIAGNEWNAKRTFYKADGGISSGSELLEQNFNCPTGFSGVGGQTTIEASIIVKERDGNNQLFSSNPVSNAAQLEAKLKYPTSKYDAAYPLDANGVLPEQEVGYLNFEGVTNKLPGGALQMAAGYEGKGKSSAHAIAKFVDIYSKYLGTRGSEACIQSQWRHISNTEGNCKY